MHHDIIIIGGGAAGMSAAVYATRAGKSVAVLESMYHGGQAATTHEIDNYLGFSNGISGPELMELFHAHAERFGAQFVYENAEGVIVNSNEPGFSVKTATNAYTASSIIIATGAHPMPLNVVGEDRLRGAGVSYCATCDGAFFRGKKVAVVGGGNTAVEDALYLADLCEKVYIIHRRDELRADKVLAEKLLANNKIEPIWNTIVEEICGENSVEYLRLSNTQNLEVNGVFIAVGNKPNSEIFKGFVDLDERGYIKTNENMQTSVAGVYAAGDIRTTPLRQVITAAADGAIAAFYASKNV